MFFTNGGVGLENMTRPLKSKNSASRRIPDMVSIKITLTGKLAEGGRNLIYCAQFGEIVQKLSKSGGFQNSAIFECFWTFSSNRSK